MAYTQTLAVTALKMRQLLFTLLVLTGCNARQVTIQADELGVTDSDDKILAPGTHTIDGTVTVYDIKEFSTTENVDILSKDKQSVSGEFYIRCYPDKKNIARLHKTFGPEYKDVAISPETRASIRRIFAKINADSLITIDKADIESMIKSDLSKVLADRDIILSYFEIKRLILPTELKIVNELNLKNEYLILKTSNNWTDKQKAIDSFLKNGTKDALKVLFQIYADDKDPKTRDYIISNVKSSYR